MQSAWLLALLGGCAPRACSAATRDRLRCHTLSSLLQVARLQLLKKLARTCASGEMSLAFWKRSPFGSLDPQLDERGVPRNPWLRRAYEDVLVLGDLELRVAGAIHAGGWLEVLSSRVLEGVGLGIVLT